MKWLRERMPEKKILPHVRRLILSVICLFIWLPLLMMAGNSFLSRGEMLSRFGPVLNGGTGAVKVTLFPDFPTLSPFVELLLDSPGFFVMFWNSCLQTGAVLFGQMLVAVPAAWAFAMYSFPGKKVLFMGYIILMILPFQVLMTPDYFVLNQMHILDTHLAVILPGYFPHFRYLSWHSSFPRSHRLCWKRRVWMGREKGRCSFGSVYRWGSRESCRQESWAF